jgi:hypothetical protein
MKDIPALATICASVRFEPYCIRRFTHDVDRAERRYSFRNEIAHAVLDADVRSVCVRLGPPARLGDERGERAFVRGQAVHVRHESARDRGTDTLRGTGHNGNAACGCLQRGHGCGGYGAGKWASGMAGEITGAIYWVRSIGERHASHVGCRGAADVGGGWKQAGVVHIAVLCVGGGAISLANLLMLAI